MNSWWPPSNAGDEPPSSAYPRNGWPAPHAGSSNQPSPSRRDHAVQPPPLTTALSGQQFQGLGVALGAGYASTPLSTTSLSSPFTQSQSPAVTTPGGFPATSSAMASRQYTVPYNPQDWGPVNGAHMHAAQSAYPQANNMLRVMSHHRPAGHSEMSLSPPPPPYSPPSQPQQQQHRDHVNQGPAMRAGSASPGAVSTYNGQVHHGADTPVEYRQQPLPRTRPLSVVGDAGLTRQVSLPPPPPLPQGVPSSRSSSHNRTDVYREQPAFASSSRAYVMASPPSMQPSHPSNHNNHMVATAQYDDMSRPPASRRAVSAGPIVGSASTSRATSQSRSRSPPGGGWEPGMPLPPPPPGPPPSSTRSQSVSGLSDASSLRHSQSAARTTRTRPPPVLGTGLDSIPPTPADWVEEGSAEARQRGKAPLHIDTTSTSLHRPDTNGTGSVTSAHPSQSSSTSGLFRSPAIRDTSTKGIRERRVERRNRQSQVMDDFSAVSMSSNPWAEALEQVKPSNLVLDDVNVTPEHPRQQATTRATPRSNHSVGSDGQQPTSRSRASSTGLFSNRSSFSTPRAEPSPLGPSRGYAQTPPFSPDGDKPSTFPKGASPALPPKALPTPPLQSAQEVHPPSRPGSREDRPVSHILHLPNDQLQSVSTLSPRRVPMSQGPSLNSVVNQDATFMNDAIQRHKEFIEKEAGAADEAEALRVFTEFIIAESQVRRERYSKIWGSNSLDLEGVRRKLFELPPKPAPPPQPVVPPSLSRRPSRGAPRLDIPQQSRPESAWWSNYKPCLSPIASLSMSNDEMSSRGRAPSRWWESKSSSEGGERRILRSKRESKYMGLPRESLQWPQGRDSVEASNSSDAFESGDQFTAYGPDEYPPEKVGWHEDFAPSEYSSTAGHSISKETQKMDVSRLITLPPPYPRHHPAVNNSHPDLVAYRTLVRSISDLSEVKTTRQRHKTEVETLSQAHQERIQEGRRQFKANIQSQIQQGSITFAEAAEAEAALIEEENKHERNLAKQELDAYQNTVLKPMHAILNDRITKATTCINELRSKMFDDAQHETPDQTQEEGDEKPELLEKLTQLKWLFEAREQLHREMHDLVSDRDEKYKAVVLLPYKQKLNEEKVRETNAFFVKDAQDRRVNYEAAALARLESFLAVIEENAARGVELQLSAFWDIAPSLLTLVQQVPEDLDGFQIQIPANEYEENPSYHRHPLQYLYTLISHAEKSSYQYIESQINLFCLLHEVKSAVMKANCKLMEAQRIRQGEAEDSVRREMQDSRADEERALTNDLKDKVATVEGQWTEALGSAIQGLRERAKEQLMEENGWEDLERLEEA
ncbi:hypothetical protein P170DRAFT_374521 [Aspergillus steynii IBT 23096]|uniref:Uncharacterized protein n=1 Tax=Aspergillus steynii IBT 23096 TaxID=1392250 RepID=A0A2I2GQ99_9EURO|nr:uncharacterized protein P170DRAFT_374521 [Aspergillus steynii IBT 23096]PLB55049.1 hypothetical protein P170DRAFT_374521 [Aspergillus steynii IBT 23096]